MTGEMRYGGEVVLPWGVRGVRPAAPPAEGVTKDSWNGWCLDYWPNGGWHIVHDRMAYPIDLDRFRTSAVVLDAIAQVTGKLWATDEVIAGLGRAINDVLHPQAHLCSCGSHKRMTGKVIAARARLLAEYQEVEA